MGEHELRIEEDIIKESKHILRKIEGNIPIMFRKNIKKGLGSRTKNTEVQVASNAPKESLIPEIHQLLKQQVTCQMRKENFHFLLYPVIPAF